MTVQCPHSKLGALISLGVLALTVHAHGQVINTVAGNGTPGGQFSQAAFFGGGGPASEASLLVPGAVSVDANGNVFIADTGNQRIRRVDGDTGVITTIAGPLPGLSPDEQLALGVPESYVEGFRPEGISVDGEGNIFFADSGNHGIHRIDVVTGAHTTVAGSGSTGLPMDGELATNTGIPGPTGLHVDPSGICTPPLRQPIAYFELHRLVLIRSNSSTWISPLTPTN